MISKLARIDFIHGQPALPYQPYSKNCPQPAPPPSPAPPVATVTMCGLINVYAWRGYDANHVATDYTETDINVTNGSSSYNFTQRVPGTWVEGYGYIGGGPVTVSSSPICMQVPI